MSRRQMDIHESIDRLHAAAAKLDADITFMEVCGTHTMSAFRSGLHSLMPDRVTLLSGPGCPVCVTAQGDIDLLIALAQQADVTLCTYGDMMRVPGQNGSLEKARSCGADVRPIYSSMDAVKLAAAQPSRQVVFAAVGFETTAPASAAAVLTAERDGLANFSILASHKRVIPAMTGLLEGGQVNLDGFLCPGHVSVIIGAAPYRPIVDHYHQPCVITGFEELNMAAGLARLTEMVCENRCQLINQYPEAVSEHGNRTAQATIARVFEHADVRWRGLGVIPESGLAVKGEYRHFEAQHRFGLTTPQDHEPAGCICGKVITGLAVPHDCKLFGTVCTPINPIGPCMVSSEGTCQAWFKYRRTDGSLLTATQQGAGKMTEPVAAEALP